MEFKLEAGTYKIEGDSKGVKITRISDERVQTEEEWIKAHLKEGDLVEVRTGNDDTWFILAATKDRLRVWNCLRLPRDRWLPHLGGAMPVPGWMNVQVWFRGETTVSTDMRLKFRATNLTTWKWGGRNPSPSNIIAYRIPEEQ